MHFFDISTSKSAPNVRCFQLFQLQICFAPQRRALFRSEAEVLCTFWLGNVLPAATFSTSQLLKVLRGWGALYIDLEMCLRTLRFREPTFRPSGATNHWKNTVFRDFPTFSRTWIFFLLRLSLFWSSSSFFSSLLFSSLLFSDSSHLCFSSVHNVGSLTSKLPSINCDLLWLVLYLFIHWFICLFIYLCM